MTRLIFKQPADLLAIGLACQPQRMELLEDPSHRRHAVVCFTQAPNISTVELGAGWRCYFKHLKNRPADVHDTSWRDIGKPSL